MTPVCIYALVKDGDVVYVGQTKNPIRREREHHRSREFDDFVILAEGLNPHDGACIAELELHKLHGLSEMSHVGWHSASGTSGGSSKSTKARAAKSKSMRAWNESHQDELYARNQRLGLKWGPVNVVKMRESLTHEVLSRAGKKGAANIPRQVRQALGSKGGKIGGKVSTRLRRQCTCGVISHPAGIGNHQKSTGHVGYTEVV